MTMGHGDAYTGTVYSDDPTVHVELGMGGSPVAVGPESHASFTVSEEATHVAGFAWSYAATGAHQTVLVSPDQQTHRWSAVAPPFSFDGSNGGLVEEAVPGEWNLATAGAGQFTGGGATIAETVETRYELEDGEFVDVSP